VRGFGIGVFICIAALASLHAVARAVPSSARDGLVTHVSDGDTAYIDPLRYGDTAASWDGRKARFIGVDTPEVYGGTECYGKKASAFTTRKLQGEHVQVTYGPDPTDQYGRALVYVWLEGRLFNATLIRRGYATVEMYSPNDRYETKFRRLEAKARSAGRGLWGACR
jgi:micrococcal nuclease